MVNGKIELALISCIIVLSKTVVSLVDTATHGLLSRRSRTYLEEEVRLLGHDVGSCDERSRDFSTVGQRAGYKVQM